MKSVLFDLSTSAVFASQIMRLHLDQHQTIWNQKMCYWKLKQRMLSTIRSKMT